MPLTLGLTGMDPATEASLKAAFNELNFDGGGRWQLVPEAEAQYVIVDMDSMYGPMSWLRLHGAGKCVIGLTNSPRTQTDFRLGRPFVPQSLAGLMQEIEAQSGVQPASPAEATPSATPPAPAPELVAPPPSRPPQPQQAPEPAGQQTSEPAAVAATARSPIEPSPLPEASASGMGTAPAPQHQLPEEVPLAAQVAIAPPPPPPSPPPPPRERRLGDWLGTGMLRRRVRYRSAGSASLYIDPVAGHYYGPALLKPLNGHFNRVVEESDFEPVDEAAWSAETAALGSPQPLSRLSWYGGLLAGEGSLGGQHDPAGRYRLTKWPQTEREFPKHFRIATAMMKGPATLDEIAATSGISYAEVADFVNANLGSGFAEPYVEPPPEPTEPPRPSGILGRLRGR